MALDNITIKPHVIDMMETTIEAQKQYPSTTEVTRHASGVENRRKDTEEANTVGSSCASIQLNLPQPVITTPISKASKSTGLPRKTQGNSTDSTKHVSFLAERSGQSKSRAERRQLILQSMNHTLNRSGMGEYNVSTSTPPLTSLARPTPGPLDYSPIHVGGGGPAYTIKNKARGSVYQEEYALGPGPLAYKTESVRLPYSEAPHWTMRTKCGIEDFLQVNYDTPGPLAYGFKETEEDRIKGPSLSGKHPIQEPKIPSPNQYGKNIQLPDFNGPEYTIGELLPVKTFLTPGPNRYHPPTHPPHMSKEPAFTIGALLDNYSHERHELQSKPNPNQYDPKMLPISMASITLKGWENTPRPFKTPAPGSYFLPSPGTGPQALLLSKRAPFTSEKILGPRPDPTTYTMKDCIEFNSKPKFTLAERRFYTKNLMADVPGADAYLPKSSLGFGPKVTIKGKIAGPERMGPGPGSYELRQAFEALESKCVGTWKKNVVKESEPEVVPGPADYTMPTRGGGGPAYTIRQRPLEHKAGSVPGPNAFNLQSTMKANITLKSRPSPYKMVFQTSRFDMLNYI